MSLITVKGNTARMDDSSARHDHNFVVGDTEQSLGEYALGSENSAAVVGNGLNTTVKIAKTVAPEDVKAKLMQAGFVPAGVQSIGSRKITLMKKTDRKTGRTVTAAHVLYHKGSGQGQVVNVHSLPDGMTSGFGSTPIEAQALSGGESKVFMRDGKAIL